MRNQEQLPSKPPSISGAKESICKVGCSFQGYQVKWWRETLDSGSLLCADGTGRRFPGRGEAYQLLKRPHSTEFFTNSSTVTGLTGAAPEELQQTDGKNIQCVKKIRVLSCRYTRYLIPLPVSLLPLLLTDPKCSLALLSEEGADGR